MNGTLTSENKRLIKEGIRREYAKAAVSPEGLFEYRTGRAGLEALDYGQEIIQALPDTVKASFCGVGNPFKLGHIKEAETVLDIGSGGGVDVFIAAKMVGPGGKAVGVDMTPEMLTRARENLRVMLLDNASFHQASAEDLPFPDKTFDVVISSGVFNLIPDKARALSEVLRVLKPQGRFMLADQILIGQHPKDIEARVDSWAK
jgi:SAM-dependent methyltransferase